MRRGGAAYCAPANSALVLRSATGTPGATLEKAHDFVEARSSPVSFAADRLLTRITSVSPSPRD